MKFIGQQNILRELEVYVQEIKNRKNFNFIFQAPSGYGKTTLVERFINVVDPGYVNTLKYLPDIKGDVRINSKKRFHFIDEAHELRSPESLYPLMDRDDSSFFFATNEYDKLKEPLVNRCFSYIFSQYTDSELTQIAKNYFEKSSEGIVLPEIWYREMINYGRGNPRITKNVASRIAFISKLYGQPPTLERFHDMVADFLDTSQEGFTTLDRQYLEQLKNLGGTASFGILSGILNIPETTIRNEIEPFLLLKEKIKITSKGRKLV